ncbi:MAG: hypothetical protein CR982_06145 [Candidatus Cloacimonadota bacterium]|nr:MAG: hypothetical protein CR982_06145 [Candidatus Cloacimonadota bacterium]PIE78101.1 MAG: hypothetical protein CSA15_09705 [Candidatus Delongbacteria bacterium]
MILYSSYSFPEGALKISSVIEHFINMRFPYIAVTDHGTMGGFRTLSRLSKKRGIKPIYGFETFYKLEDGRYFRLIVYVKNSEGFKDLNKIYNSSKKSQLGFTYINNIDLLKSNNLIYLYSIYDYCYLSKQAVFVDSILDIKQEIYSSPQENSFIHLLGNKDTPIVRESQSFGIEYLKIEPIFTLSNKRKKLNYYMMKMRGFEPLKSEKFYSKPLELKPLKNCNGDFEEGNPKFSNLILDKDLHEKHKKQFYRALSSLLSEENLNSRRIKTEIKIIEKSNLVWVFTLLMEIKKDLQKRGVTIFFSGDIEYFKLSNLTELTTTDLQLFRSTFFSYLNNISPKKEIGIVCSLKHRDTVIEYLIQKFGKSKTSLLSTPKKWNISSLIKRMGKIFSYNYKDIESMLALIPQNYRNIPLLNLFREKGFYDLVKRGYISKEFFSYGVMLDRTVRDSYSSKSTIVVSSEDISKTIPVREEDHINISPLSHNDLSGSNLFSIHIRSSNLYKSIDLTTKLKSSDADILIDAIKKGSLEFIPYFKYDPVRVKIFDMGLENKFMALALYLESGLHDIHSLSDNYKKDDFPKLKNELKDSFGKIVFREQLITVINKLYKEDKFNSLRRRVEEFRYSSQLLGYLSKINDEDNTQKVKLLKKMVLPQAFRSSIIDHANRISMAIYTVKERKTNFKKFIYSNIVSLKNSDYNNAFIRRIINNYNLNFDIRRFGNSRKEVKNRIVLPLNFINGISKEFNDNFISFIDNFNSKDPIEIISNFDEGRNFKHQITLLLKVGFFDPLESNRVYLLNMVEKLYRNDLFSDVEKNSNIISDFKLDVKRKLYHEILKLNYNRKSTLLNFLTKFFDIDDEWEISEINRVEKNRSLLVNGRVAPHSKNFTHNIDDLIIYNIENDKFYNQTTLFLSSLKVVIYKSDYTEDLHKKLTPYISNSMGAKIIILDNREIETDLFLTINYQNFDEIEEILGNRRVVISGA